MVLYKHPKKKTFKAIGLVVKEWHRLEVLGSRPTVKKVNFLNFFQLFTEGFRVRLRGLHFFQLVMAWYHIYSTRASET